MRLIYSYSMIISQSFSSVIVISSGGIVTDYFKSKSNFAAENLRMFSYEDLPMFAIDSLYWTIVC